MCELDKYTLSRDGHRCLCIANGFNVRVLVSGGHAVVAMVRIPADSWTESKRRAVLEIMLEPDMSADVKHAAMETEFGSGNTLFVRVTNTTRFVLPGGFGHFGQRVVIMGGAGGNVTENAWRTPGNLSLLFVSVVLESKTDGVVVETLGAPFANTDYAPHAMVDEYVEQEQDDDRFDTRRHLSRALTEPRFEGSFGGSDDDDDDDDDHQHGPPRKSSSSRVAKPRQPKKYEEVWPNNVRPSDKSPRERHRKPPVKAKPEADRAVARSSILREARGTMF